MSYRDELTAAQARASALERELADAKATIDQLKNPAPTSPPTVKPGPVRQLGKIYFNPPRTYVPLFHLWLAAARGAWEARPFVERSDTDNLLLWLGNRVVLRPLVNVIWSPVYMVLLVLVALPWAGVVCLAASIAGLPLLVLSRLRIGDFRHARPGTGWPQADYSEGTGRLFLWTLLSFTLPFLLPVFIPVLKGD